MSSLSFYEQQHILHLLTQERQVKYIFDEFVRKTGLILTRWKGNSTDNVWIRNALLENELERELTELHAKLLSNITTHMTEGWKMSDKKIDDLVEGFIKDLSVSEMLKTGMFAHNEKPLQTLLNQKIGGVTLSGNVWNIAAGAKENVEYYLSSGISVGRPATSISQDIRQLLNAPDKRFRRLRNEEGKLVYSQPMKEYEPGRGTYRSSYKNALRTAATQTNIAYHAADYERWQGLDFVVGIEISRSRSAKGPCPICDAMKGIYPKGFKYIGWHPWCICPAVPKMLEGQEFTDFLITGKIPESKVVKNMPKGALDFVAESKSFTKSLAVQENQKMFFDSLSTKKTQVKDLREWAKDNLKGKTLTNAGLNKEIGVTTGGIKEFLNQPHEYYEEKNNLIKDIANVIKGATYLGYSDYYKDNPMINYSHVFEITIKGKKSWIIAREDTRGEVAFYGISENEKVKTGLKKK